MGATRRRWRSSGRTLPPAFADWQPSLPRFSVGSQVMTPHRPLEAGRPSSYEHRIRHTGVLRREPKAMSFSSMRNSSNGHASGTSVWLAGTSAPMREVERALGHLAHANVNLVIHGEPGTGKRVLAERIHQQGPRANDPF